MTSRLESSVLLQHGGLSGLPNQVEKRKEEEEIYKREHAIQLKREERLRKIAVLKEAIPLPIASLPTAKPAAADDLTQLSFFNICHLFHFIR